MKKLAFVLCAAASLLLIIAVLFTSLQLCMNDEDWYYGSYESYGIEKSIGISTADATRALMRLVDYMEGRVDSIQLSVVENGISVEMYNERETAHMIDVRALYQAWRSVRNFGVPAAAVLLVAGLSLVEKKKRAGFVAKAFLGASALFGAILAALGVWVAIDFNSFWIAFHHLFFTNDLWLLSYATDRMIRICPQQLFNDIVVRFALLFLIPYAIMLALALFGAFRREKKGSEPA